MASGVGQRVRDGVANGLGQRSGDRRVGTFTCGRVGRSGGTDSRVQVAVVREADGLGLGQSLGQRYRGVGTVGGGNRTFGLEVGRDFVDDGTQVLTGVTHRVSVQNVRLQVVVCSVGVDHGQFVVILNGFRGEVLEGVGVCRN